MQVATIASTGVIGALALSTGPDLSVISAIQTAATTPATTIQLVLPIDVVELVKVTFAGLATVASAFAAVYAVVGAARAKRAEAASVSNSVDLGAVKADVKLLERNTNSLTEQIKRNARKEGVDEGEMKGERQAVVTADKLAEGIAIGRAQERESVAAANPAPVSVAPAGIVPGDAPVPVEDDRAAKIGERSAVAAEKLADATKDIADTAKKP